MNREENTMTLLETFAQIGGLLSPVLLALIALIAWLVKKGYEKRIRMEESLREDRMEIYYALLEPFIISFTPDAGWRGGGKYKNKSKHQAAEEILLSPEYRRASFKLSLIGADSVVRAYNELFQYFYTEARNQTGISGSDSTAKIMRFFGNFLLEIRKSSGNETTNLDAMEMLEWLISDAKNLRDSFEK
ncbi:MAG: hypothetical protein OXS28_11005 [Gammaproteobacteria bacterium]|nr:hypothetical protein [Gammaproteobacteria bacterium]